MTCGTLVNIQTDRYTDKTAFWPAYAKSSPNWAKNVDHHWL